MERIQSAIQKARAAREKTLSDVATAEPVNVAVPQSEIAEPNPVKDTDKAWADLPRQEFSAKALRRARVVTDQPGDDSSVFDGMRTKLLHEMRKNGWRRVAITSPGSACGKSTLSLNLAFGLARQRDMRTMLIDLDLRRPSIEKMLNLPEKHAFALALAGTSDPEEHMFCYKNKLAFATNRSPAQDPSELLQGKDAARVIDGLEARYNPDVMIFDTAPLLTCDDTNAFLDQIDCVLLVAAAETSTVEEMKKCEHEIREKSNLLGVVLNKCRYLEKPYTYGY